MSTIRATYVQHGSSAVPNITLNASGQVIVASGLVSSGTFAAPSGTAAAPGVYFDGDTDTGLYSPSANQIAVATSGTAHLTVDDAGRLLVGTSSARSVGIQASLQVERTGSFDNAASISITNNESTGWSSYLRFAKTRSGSNGTFGAVQNTDQLGYIGFYGSSASSLIEAANIQAVVDGTNISTTSMPTRLVFSTTADGSSSPTERMRIGNNGSVQIGSNGQLATELFRVTSSSTWGAAIENNNNASGDRNLYLTLGTNCNNTSSYFLDCTTATVGPKFYVYGNGTYGTVSDVNLKKNIETTRDGYLDDIQKLRVVKYNWKTDDDGAPKELGWIAQELAEVFPGLVQDSQPAPDGNTVKEVKTSVLPFILLKALQEAAAKIETLKAEVQALKAQ